MQQQYVEVTFVRGVVSQLPSVQCEGAHILDRGSCPLLALPEFLIQAEAYELVLTCKSCVFYNMAFVEKNQLY